MSMRDRLASARETRKAIAAQKTVIRTANRGQRRDLRQDTPAWEYDETRNQARGKILDLRQPPSYRNPDRALPRLIDTAVRILEPREIAAPAVTASHASVRQAEYEDREAG